MENSEQGLLDLHKLQRCSVFQSALSELLYLAGDAVLLVECLTNLHRALGPIPRTL